MKAHISRDSIGIPRSKCRKIEIPRLKHSDIEIWEPKYNKVEKRRPLSDGIVTLRHSFRKKNTSFRIQEWKTKTFRFQDQKTATSRFEGKNTMAFFTIKCDLHYTNKQLACNVKMKKKNTTHSH